MPIPPSPDRTPSALPAEALRGLRVARLLLLAVEALGLTLVVMLTPIHLPWVPMLGLLLLHAVFIAVGRVGEGAGAAAFATGSSVFLSLLADAAVIAALVYLSGGNANPFITLLLLPLILCAALLPAVLTWAMTAWVALLYSLLTLYYRPLQAEWSEFEAHNLHLVGMWLGFLFSAILVAIFVSRLNAVLRARDRALAEAREVALRDEQLFALGMQAAAAAHDLATPLATLGLTLDEMRAEYANDEELGPSLQGMADQTARMKVVLGRLRDFAGAARDAQSQMLSAAGWLEGLAEHWQLMRPQTRLVLRRTAKGPAPMIRDEALLASSLVTLFNNAADAAPECIEVEFDCSATTLEVRVLDRGPGLGAETATGGGKIGGWGVGLQLAQAALARLRGELEFRPRAGGGTVAVLRVPIDSLSAQRIP